MKQPFLLAMVIALTAGPATASDWAFLGSQHGLLRDKDIADVGTVQEQTFTTPDRLEYDPLLQMNVWKPGDTIRWTQFTGTRTLCFRSAYPGQYTLSQAALLLVDTTGNVYLATFSSTLGSIQVDVNPVTPVACPNPW